MSKEQTPIEELIKEKQEKYETWFYEFGYAFSYIRMGDFKKAVEETVTEIITKEKEQREEEIKEAVINFAKFVQSDTSVIVITSANFNYSLVDLADGYCADNKEKL